MPGPPPKPTHLKLVTGNPGRRPLNKREPKPKPGIPSVPAHLSPKPTAERAAPGGTPRQRLEWLLAALDEANDDDLAEAGLAQPPERLAALLRGPLSGAQCNAAGERLLSQATPEARERWGRRFTCPSAIRAARKAEEHDLCRRVASLIFQTGRGDGSLVREVWEIVSRYQSGAWRHERGNPAPLDPLRAAMHRMLTVTRGKTLSKRGLERVLAGLSPRPQYAKSPDRLRKRS
jgi:hypothetical protein